MRQAINGAGMGSVYEAGKCGAGMGSMGKDQDQGTFRISGSDSGSIGQGWDLWDGFGIYGSDLGSVGWIWSLTVACCAQQFTRGAPRSVGQLQRLLGARKEMGTGFVIYGAEMKSVGWIWDLWGRDGICGSEFKSMGQIWDLWGQTKSEGRN